jgi:trk system potassium uptake protein TrkA
MKIIILGAGQVGGTLAANLASEKNDIVIIDSDADRLRELQDHHDIATVTGHASDPAVLERAGAEDADMLVAVTNSDEINMMACQVAATLFRIPSKIARIRSRAYLKHREALFNNDAVPIDVIISPEQVVTEHIQRLLETPGALQVLDFADGKVQLVAVRAYYGGPLVGRELQEIRQHIPGIDTRIAAIFRGDTPIPALAETVIETDDVVYFMANTEHILPVMAELRRLDRPYRRIMIAGGGNIGERLAKRIEKQFQVKLIEMNYSRCRQLAEVLHNTIVLNGSASNRDLLKEENIEECDVFLALTNSDEANIMASLLAKKHGARKIITLITNPAYVDLVQDTSIDIVISPQLITISSLLTYVRRGDISKVHALRRGAAEAIEVIAHGDKKNSKVVGRRIDQINLPVGVTIVALVRDEEVLIAHDDIVVESEDHVILFLVDKSSISKIEKLFQVGFGFF